MLSLPTFYCETQCYLFSRVLCCFISPSQKKNVVTNLLKYKTKFYTLIINNILVSLI